MQIKIVQDAALRFLKDNATTVLTAGGVVGTVTTAVLSAKAGFKAAQILAEKEEELRVKGEGPDAGFSTTEKIKIVAPHAIPPVVLGTLTISSIVGANMMSAKRAAVLAAAYGVSQKQLDEYKAKVEEKLGIQKTQKLEDELAQDRVNREAPKYGQLIVIEGEVLCFDEPTGRFFNSTVEKINRAVNSVNREIATHGYCGAEQFYDELELPPTTWADGVGWNLDNQCELKITSVLTPDDKPCVSIDFRRLPETDYARQHS